MALNAASDQIRFIVAPALGEWDAMVSDARRGCAWRGSSKAIDTQGLTLE